jgi:hypothetical protein
MKIRLYIAALLGLSLMVAACKKENTIVDPPGGGDVGNYFPDNNGAYYRFNFEYQDTLGTTIAGERVTRYTGTSVLSGTTYMQQTDSMLTAEMNTASVSYFRKTDTGVMYYLDTTGLGNTIPDTLMQYVTLDAEMRALVLPLLETSVWPVFKMTFTYIINLTVIEVSANVAGKENITLNLVSGSENKEAYRIRYVLTLRLPDPENLLNTITETYEAHCWVVSGIGIVRWQGSAAVVAAFTGGGIDIDESAAIVTQNLVEYRLN